MRDLVRLLFYDIPTLLGNLMPNLAMQCCMISKQIVCKYLFLNKLFEY